MPSTDKPSTMEGTLNMDELPHARMYVHLERRGVKHHTEGSPRIPMKVMLSTDESSTMKEALDMNEPSINVRWIGLGISSQKYSLDAHFVTSHVCIFSKRNPSSAYFMKYFRFALYYI